MSAEQVSETIIGALLMGVVCGGSLGLILGRWLYRNPETEHAHQWGPWKDAEITVYPCSWGVRTGQQYDAQGQERRCQSCNQQELRKVG